MTIHKILICDDSEIDLVILKTVLEKSCRELITATSGEEVLKKAKSEKPDVIFLDIVMPGMDGYAACRALRDDPDTKDIPVIFVSSRDQKSSFSWAKMQGAKDYIVKPYNSQDVIEKLKTWVLLGKYSDYYSDEDRV